MGWYQRRVHGIRLTNTGQVVAQYRLVPKLEETRLCKPWITVDRTFGMLLPGEEVTIKITITVDNAAARTLNRAEDILDDILILRLENGRDFYVTVRADYARSCFGMGLEELVTYAEPIRTVPLDSVKRVEHHTPDRVAASRSAALCIPKELWRIVDAIYSKGIGERDIFLLPGLDQEVRDIRECLDTGAEFGEFRVHSMAETLLSFLSDLDTPVIHPEVLPGVADVSPEGMTVKARSFLEEMSPIHYNVFVYMISFFREALHYQASNRLSPAKVSRICSSVMVPRGSGPGGNGGGSNGNGQDQDGFVKRKKCIQEILEHFLTADSL